MSVPKLDIYYSICYLLLYKCTNLLRTASNLRLHLFERRPLRSFHRSCWSAKGDLAVSTEVMRCNTVTIKVLTEVSNILAA